MFGSRHVPSKIELCWDNKQKLRDFRDIKGCYGIVGNHMRVTRDDEVTPRDAKGHQGTLRYARG